MKAFLAALLTVYLLCALPCFGAYYQWTDDKGVVHFTDNRDKIPGKYRKKARKLNLSEEPRSGGTPPVQVVPMEPAGEQKAPPQTPPQQRKQTAPQAAPGGHSEQWWRQHFADLNKELKEVQERLTANRAKLAQAQRRRAIYTRIQDRQAVNAAQAQVSADEAQMNDVLARIESLSRDAASAGAPPEWRQ